MSTCETIVLNYVQANMIILHGDIHAKQNTQLTFKAIWQFFIYLMRIYIFISYDFKFLLVLQR